MLNLKFALRMLFKTPVVTVSAILSLALGIGANAAIFSLFNQILIRPLPVADPDRLVNLGAPGPKPGSDSSNQAGSSDEVFSYPMFRDLERQQSVFAGIAAHRLFGVNLAARGQTLHGDGMLVSGGYFPLLGLQPALGRLLGPEDDRLPAERHVAVLSHSYWDARFARDPGVIGQALIVNGESLTIIGVAPRGFNGTTLGGRPQVFVPIALADLMQRSSGVNRLIDRRNYWTYLFARLEHGSTLEQSSAGINVLYHSIVNEVDAPLQRGMSDQTLARFRAKRMSVADGRHGQSNVLTNTRTPLALLLAVTAFVLLIACANIANLLVARSAARAGEMAVRLSIGASRWQLIVQLLTEGCLLALFGAVAGLVVAGWTLDGIGMMMPPEALAVVDLRLDSAVVMFAAALAIGTGLLFGLFPAFHSTRPDLIATIKSQAGQPSGSRGAARFRTVLATTQIALSMALLVSAGLFARSLLNVTRVDLGLKTDNLITFRLSPALSGYTPDRSRQLFERLEDELATLPGATAVTDSIISILADNSWGGSLKVEGFQAGPDTDTNARRNGVGAGYFRSMGIPLLSGREFTRGDASGAPKVAIVNEAFVGKFNLGRNPLGKHLGASRDATLDTEIIGLVRNSKYNGVKLEVPPLVYRPYRQEDGLGVLTFYVRTALDPDTMLEDVTKVVTRLDPNLPVEGLKTMPQQVLDNVFLDRFLSVLSAAFACLATLLAAIGLYGVLAYSVAQRTREIGLRMALGADASRVRAMILKQVGLMTVVGSGLGLAGAIGLGRLAESLLFELKGSDPIVFAGSAILLSLIALAAGFIPAHRASRVDPMQALRYE